MKEIRMKSAKRTLAALLAAWLLLSALPLQGVAASFTARSFVSEKAAAAGETVVPASPKARDLAGRAEIDEATAYFDVAQVRAYLSEEFARCSDRIDVSFLNLPFDKRTVLSGLIYYAMPESFHIGSLSMGSVSGVTSAVIPEYTMTADEYADKLAACRAKADELLTGIRGNDALTTAQKLLLIHDRLILQTKYPVLGQDAEGYTTYPEGTTHEDFATICSCLIRGEAVCQGYAETFNYLAGLIGVESYYVNSAARYHAWNMVYVDGEPYFVDVTADDPVYDVPGRVNHGNFLLSSAAFRDSAGNLHNGGDYDLLPQDTRYDDAFWKTSNAAFQLVGSEIYYVDNAGQAIRRWSDGASICDVTDSWPHSTEGYIWSGNYTRLDSYKGLLLYTLHDEVYRLNPRTGEKAILHRLSSPFAQFSIFGFRYVAPHLRLSTYNSPLFLPEMPDNYEQLAYWEWNCAHESGVDAAAEASTCASHGHAACVICADCGALLSGDDTPLPLDPDNHQGPTELANVKAPTPTDPGYSGDWICAACGGIVAQGERLYYAGDDLAWRASEQTQQDLSVKVYLPAGVNFLRAELYVPTESGEDPVGLTANDYSFENGALTVKDAALKKLESGVYRLLIVCDPGSASVSVTVQALCKHTGGRTVHAETASTCSTPGHRAYVACADCGAVLAGDDTPLPLDPANHAGGSHYGEAVAPSCSAPGHESDLICDGCGGVITAGAVIPALPHTPSGWVIDANTHCQYCTVCHQKYDEGAHTGGAATCAHKAVCTVCGAEYGEIDPADHAGAPMELTDAKEPTAAGPGYSGNYRCTACGEIRYQGVALYYVEETSGAEPLVWSPETGKDPAFTPHPPAGSDLLRVDLYWISGEWTVNTGLPQNAWRYESGVLTLNEAYLKTLFPGYYEVWMVFDGGSAKAPFVIPCVRGDANGDGAVDTADLIRLANYLASPDPVDGRPSGNG
ncbi:MAG: hypothetical protein II776_08185 [Clostridia bacterium]|nr:hypothetical protein [Clostridia bacterium]